VARVDIPFLSDSADEVGGFVIDRWPFVFRKVSFGHLEADVGQGGHVCKTISLFLTT
jgi:hypothetical protein